MSGKQVHIVFQVLNFILGEASNPYRLSSNEEKMLLILAKHKGNRGIYPSIATLAKESKRDRRNTMRTLRKLEQKELISISKQQGISNHYELVNILASSGVYATSDINATSDANATGVVASTPQTSGAGAPQSIQRRIHNKKTEREERSLSLFIPDHQSRALANQLGLNLDDEVKSFTERHRGAKTDYEFERWLKNSREYLNNKAGKVKDEPKCTVKFWEPGNPDYDRLHGVTSNGQPERANAANGDARGNGVRKAAGYIFR